MQPTDQERKIDQWLDRALQRYGEAEPRLGLEGRILAHLQSTDARFSEPWRWWPALATLAAMLLIGAAIFVGSAHRESSTKLAKVEAPAVHSSQSSPELGRAPDAATMTKVPKQRRKAQGQKQPAQEMKTIEPRLEQFPSPQPLSEQEQILARYVDDLPSEAKQMARAQTELLQRDPLEFAEQEHSPDSAGKSSQ